MPWPTMHITQPVIFEIVGDEVFASVICGEETIRLALSPNMLLMSVEAAKREYERWQNGSNCRVLPFFIAKVPG